MNIESSAIGIVRNPAPIAAIVCELIRTHQPVACSLQMGYMVIGGNHSRVNFSDHYNNGAWDSPRVVSETRNRAGRCTAQVVEYKDGSRVRYTWSESRGASYSS